MAEVVDGIGATRTSVLETELQDTTTPFAFQDSTNSPTPSVIIGETLAFFPDPCMTQMHTTSTANPTIVEVPAVKRKRKSNTRKCATRIVKHLVREFKKDDEFDLFGKVISYQLKMLRKPLALEAQAYIHTYLMHQFFKSLGEKYIRYSPSEMAMSAGTSEYFENTPSGSSDDDSSIVDSPADEKKPEILQQAISTALYDDSDNNY